VILLFESGKFTIGKFKSPLINSSICLFFLPISRDILKVQCNSHMLSYLALFVTINILSVIVSRIAMD
jgi:hypothetical protein